MIDPFKKMYMSVFILSFVFELLHAQEKQVRCKGNILFPKMSQSRAYAQRISIDVDSSTLPKKFDARLKWPNCKSIRRIKDQGKCGGCWAFSSTSVIADRICISSNGKYDLDISVQDLLECCMNCTSNYGKALYPACTEGYPHRAFEWFIENGIVTGGREGCKPLEESVTKGQYKVRCEEKCSNPAYSIPYNKDKWYGKKWVFLDTPHYGPEYIQQELFINGPMVATFHVFRYMNNLPPGYVIHFNESLLDPDEKHYVHAVKVIGWDIPQNGTPIWIIANSWGEGWCDEGFCKIRGEQDGLRLEAYMMTAGVPILKNDDNKPEKENTKQNKSGDANQTSRYSNIFFGIYGLSIATIFILLLNTTIQLIILKI